MKTFPQPPVIDILGKSLSVLNARASLPSHAYSYQIGTNTYGLDAIIGDELDIDEGKMSVWVPFADGKRRDSVGDLLEVGGIRTERHRANPIVLWNHGKEQQIPIGLTEDRDTKAYTVAIDPTNQIAKACCFFYSGTGIKGVDRSQEYQHALFCEQIFDMLCKRLVRSGSIGYQVVQAQPLPPDPQRGVPRGLHLLSVNMLEASVVVLPANQDTVRKSIDAYESWQESVTKLVRDNQLCGKELSPVLYKSLVGFAAPRKAISGGLADNKKPSQFDPKKLAEGARVEMEHTDDLSIAREIAMDHLTEDPDYYAKLRKVEEKIMASGVREKAGRYPPDITSFSVSPPDQIEPTGRKRDVGEVVSENVFEQVPEFPRGVVRKPSSRRKPKHVSETEKQLAIQTGQNSLSASATKVKSNRLPKQPLKPHEASPEDRPFYKEPSYQGIEGQTETSRVIGSSGAPLSRISLRHQEMAQAAYQRSRTTGQNSLPASAAEEKIMASGVGTKASRLPKQRNKLPAEDLHSAEVQLIGESSKNSLPTSKINAPGEGASTAERDKSPYKYKPGIGVAPRNDSHIHAAHASIRRNDQGTILHGQNSLPRSAAEEKAMVKKGITAPSRGGQRSLGETKVEGAKTKVVDQVQRGKIGRKMSEYDITLRRSNKPVARPARSGGAYSHEDFVREEGDKIHVVNRYGDRQGTFANNDQGRTAAYRVSGALVSAANAKDYSSNHLEARRDYENKLSRAPKDRVVARHKPGLGTHHGSAACSKAQPSDDISKEKARQILSDGTVHGEEITGKQRRMFQAAAHKSLREKYKSSREEFRSQTIQGEHHPRQTRPTEIYGEDLEHPQRHAGRAPDPKMSKESRRFQKNPIRKLGDREVVRGPMGATKPDSYSVRPGYLRGEPGGRGEYGGGSGPGRILGRPSTPGVQVSGYPKRKTIELLRQKYKALPEGQSVTRRKLGRASSFSRPRLGDTATGRASKTPQPGKPAPQHDPREEAIPERNPGFDLSSIAPTDAVLPRKKSISGRIGTKGRVSPAALSRIPSDSKPDVGIPADAPLKPTDAADARAARMYVADAGERVPARTARRSATLGSKKPARVESKPQVQPKFGMKPEQPVIEIEQDPKTGVWGRRKDLRQKYHKGYGVEEKAAPLTPSGTAGTRERIAQATGRGGHDVPKAAGQQPAPPTGPKPTYDVAKKTTYHPRPAGKSIEADTKAQPKKPKLSETAIKKQVAKQREEAEQDKRNAEADTAEFELPPVSEVRDLKKDYLEQAHNIGQLEKQITSLTQLL